MLKVVYGIAGSKKFVNRFIKAFTQLFIYIGCMQAKAGA
jgi:hypothetical protein